ERSARVYAYVGSDATNLKTGWTLYQNLIYPSEETGVRGAVARYIGSSTNAYSHKLIRPAKYQDIVVKPGEKETVTIPKGKEIGFTFIKYFESSNIVANASYQYDTKAVTTSESYLLYKPLLANSELTGTDLYRKYIPSTGLEKSVTTDVVADGTGNVLFGVSPFADYVGYIPVSYDDRFDGAQTFRMRYDLENFKKIKFDLTAPAKVYILTDITGNDFENLKGCLDGWNVMGDGEESLIKFYNIVDDIVDGKELSFKPTEKTSFEKTYYVDYGETETVDLDFSRMAFPTEKIIMVLVQPLN
ncbi:MAG: hypothetical protein II244_07075, partial [Clostridia bacterium]|nr:hypothetical protein [Clostridia bacterium]